MNIKNVAIALTLMVFGVFIGGVAASALFADRDVSPAMTEDKSRQQKCEEYLAAASFPAGGASEQFMTECLSGAPVLPEDMPELPIPENTGGGDYDTPYVGAGCAIGGCSRQLCGESGEVSDIATTCEWREEYACYAASRCERQTDGQCGWTETTEFTQCVTDARNAPAVDTAEPETTETMPEPVVY